MILKLANKSLSVVAIIAANLLFATLFAQTSERNLIPNPGFEIYKGKRPLPVIQSAKPWMNVGTVDFYNKIDEQDTSAFKGPRSGKCYMGLRFQAQYKEYAYVKLIETLKKGKEYHFSMYVRLNNTSTVSIQKLGVNFSDIPFKVGMMFKSEHIIDSVSPTGLIGNHDWMHIRGKYIAKGGEKYIIIGNFTTVTKDDFIVKNKWKIFQLKEAYYYVDDMALLDSSYIKPVNALTQQVVEQDTVSVVQEDTTTTKDPILSQVRILYFEKASHRLEQTSIGIIDELVILLKSNPSFEVSIEGYTDNLGHPEKNIALSKERAQTVYSELKLRGARNIMLADGFGAANPIVPNSTSENRARNRRVEIHLTKKN